MVTRTGALSGSRLAVVLFLSAVLLHIDDSRAAASAPEKSAKSVQTGLASYYSKRFDGKKTASGETFSNAELVAAHRTLPLGTRVRVTNLENDETVELRITDRGASAKNHQEGVIIDVSQAAATRLKMKKDGRVKVRVEVLEWGEDRKAARGS